jgi:diaminohydroxyphosphoribosylaminopyrimidine deaminase/5-amino-6-(5-phosphoribosylamino)uracil reductase
VVAKFAQTLDGKIATATGASQWITSAGTRAWARARRDQFDAILVGVNTVLKDDPRLNAATKGLVIKKIVLDASLRTPPSARLFKGMPASSCIVAVGRQASVSRRRSFQQRGVIVLVCPSRRGHIDLRWLLRELGNNGVRSVLIEGGATVLGQALSRGLVDEVHCYIAPKIAGDQKALGSVVGRSWRSVTGSIGLSSMKVRTIGKDVLIKAYVLRHR